jgi:hypothetical protein
MLIDDVIKFIERIRVALDDIKKITHCFVSESSDNLDKILAKLIEDLRAIESKRTRKMKFDAGELFGSLQKLIATSERDGCQLDLDYERLRALVADLGKKITTLAAQVEAITPTERY